MLNNDLRHRDNTMEKTLLAISGLFLLFSGIDIWSNSTSVPGVNLVSLLAIGGGLTISVFGFIIRRRSNVIAAEWLCVALVILTFCFYIFSAIYTQPSYGTDEIAFDQYAAQLLLHGKDPYGMNLSQSLRLFQVPNIFHTYTVTGQAVEHLSYPALSFLAYVPLMALGIHAQAAVYVDSLFWAASILLLYVLLPRPYKMFSVFLGSSLIYQQYVSGGVVSSLYIPFLILAAYKWDRFANEDQSFLVKWMGPVFLGIAASFKPTPWFVAPFILLAIYKESRSWRRTAHYAALGFSTFVLINIPFIIWHPYRWLQGIFVPFLSPNIPSGQGIINLTMFEHLGGGRLSLYTAAAALLVVGLLVAEWEFYGWLKRILFLLPSLILFFPSRSFAAYLIYLFPIALVGFTTIRAASDEEFNGLDRKVMSRKRMVMLGFVPSIIALAVAVLYPAPLKARILSVSSTGELGSIEQVKVRVKNVTNQPQRPYFTISMAPQVTTFWNINQGPRLLAPKGSATYILDAPNVESMPPITGGFLVDIFTTKPTSLTTTHVYQPQIWHTYISPDSIDKIQPLHQKVQLQVQILDRLGRPVHISGIPVSLSQIVYAQGGLYGGESSINGNSEGRSPVTTITNENGDADFFIVGDQPQANPIYYQAYISQTKHYPYGYSEIVSIRFK